MPTRCHENREHLQNISQVPSCAGCTEKALYLCCTEVCRRFLSPISFASWAGGEKSEYGPVVSPLYEVFGKDFEQHGEYYEVGSRSTHSSHPQAEKIYIRGTTHAQYSQMLVRWAKAVTDTEKDLLITRSVLRCLLAFFYSLI